MNFGFDDVVEAIRRTKKEMVVYVVSANEKDFGICSCQEKRVEKEDHILVVRCSSCHFEKLRDHRCLGITQKGRRCQAQIFLYSGYCHRHRYQEEPEWQREILDSRTDYL